MRKSRILATLLLVSVFQAVQARELLKSEDGVSSLKVSTTLEEMGLLSVLPSGATVSSLFGNLRLDLLWQMGPKAQWDLAYENSLTHRTGTSNAFSSALQPDAPAPYRIRQVDGVLGRSDSWTDVHELDRASFEVHSSRWDLTLGRQGVGWGRGEYFSAVDIFAPFTPLEIDRSWRRGIDAFRADWKITDTTSADLVSAWGPTWDTSALGLRLKGYVGPADAEVLLAKRATDVMFGLTTSEAVLGAEVHGEFAVFRTRDDAADIRFFGETNLVPKAVVGVSYNFDIGSGLKTLLEYHYSGFGPQDPSILSARLADPDFLVRWQRGDTQIEGRQAAALQGSYSFDTKWGASLLVLQSLIDSSGVLAPSVSLDLSDNFGLQGTVFLGYGPGSVGSVLQSQFGSVPPTFILKMSIYD